MSIRQSWASKWLLAIAILFVVGIATSQQVPTEALKAQLAPPQETPSAAQNKITADQAKQLFGLVDELIKFSSDETGLPIKATVKRQIISREAVEKNLKEKFEEDDSAKRLQQSEIVLKKFGLLDRDFALKPFLLALLKEQIEAYYEPKTKTVYLLDWVDAEEQKPVLAHELTHALQDQHSDLTKWNDQTPDEVSHTYAEDVDHVNRDEMDTAREAVVEGQATAVMMDYILKPMGKSLVKDPEVIEAVGQQMNSAENSPVLSRAPLLLAESMLFPYREGLSFEQDVWMDQGQTAAFAGTLDQPPTSSWEILNPREYERRHAPSVPLLPNIHALVDPLYKPYDIGQIGQLDLRILVQIFGGEQAASQLTPAWDGGIYWAGQLLSAKTPEAKAKTDSLAIFYLSSWKNASSAQAFAQLYANQLRRKYDRVQLETSDDRTASTSADQEMVYSTSEGPVVITLRGKRVFVAESFPLDVARKLSKLVLDAQGSGEVKMAATQPVGSTIQLGAPGPDFRTWEPLTANLIRFFANCGVMKAAVEAEIKSVAR
ncbi:MAG: hypothetical protein WCF54_10455 [Terracidiphilus sp.]